MSDPPVRLPSPLVFAYEPGELTRWTWIAWRGMAQIAPRNPFWIVVSAMLLVLLFVVLGVQKAGWISADEGPDVLLAVWLAYILGVGLTLSLISRRTRQLLRAMEEMAGHTLEVTFSDTGMAWKSDIIEVHMTRCAVKSVEILRDSVVIWTVQRQGYLIPSRVFADSAARQALVVAVQSEIERAGVMSP